MKSTHGGHATSDASVLKAFCDKHVPAEWRKGHNVDAATAEAKEYYRYAMRGRRWADSQIAALSLPGQPTASVEGPDEAALAEDPTGATGNKRKRSAQQKTVWRLPSGAPVVPQVVFDNVEASLARFGVRKRKEFVAETWQILDSEKGGSQRCDFAQTIATSNGNLYIYGDHTA